MKNNNPRKNPQQATNKKKGQQPERIQKLLAQAGVGSRRQVEKWILDGSIHVNGDVAKLGDKITTHDIVKLRGRPVKLAGKLDVNTQVLVYHKPTGEIVSKKDPEGRPSVFKRLPRLKVGRWIAIGRLDLNTQGLLMFTNDGDLANKLMHPSKQIDREYAVRVMGVVTHDMLERLVNGVELEDGKARFEDVQESGGEGINRWFHVVVAEGRNRVVRRLWESQDCKVSRLIRVRYGSVFLPPGLPAGQHQMLDKKEIEALKHLIAD
ncbi:MAG: 23S rRNA pseudouridine2605 synthase [Cycloclasticus pugetii]|jgi:23S rRNA pseudouridine2605 synthase|uniref:Pseudouridine synthase n=2 Tax=Cycloclasticus TaxID=34067 RepID=S5T962_9GAMM|nr:MULTISPECIES: pseudouridine synthase [Cycloclasticus]AFT66783.1 Ribosomal large subunit pseudouridine synthase B [Cycloclasticus sp. P1]AGS40164.1 Ribosomal large subunit pseudouridine synthase B [Cycloclasticus zancles 78-ME]ATI03587.1 pseudouridine synthase [Cycloclasticus sp. PY97N]EPD14074.1 ribosomal large subunit pseudouridine synthase B [Cycloclasticus pugetii]MBV1898288.1 pseudouridine synthase [Cycloclasticus sp.]|tara:strand:+ start:2499 stop:3293 length:795 start_codon:yes stop_codon:yes gene_type:complete